MLGLPPEGRKFTPHVTLARLSSPSLANVQDFLARQNLFVSRPFEVSRFVLFSSRPSRGGGPYGVVDAYDLGAGGRVCPMAHLLSEDERHGALAELPGWQAAPDGNAISKSFKFKSFNEAFAFMTRAALVAEKLDHHPEWSNVYNRVEVTLSTHSAGGVTELDIALRQKDEWFLTFYGTADLQAEPPAP